MSFFRQRIWINPAVNLPQMESGKVKFSIGSYRIGVPIIVLDPFVTGISVGTNLGAVNIYTSTTTLTLDSEMPGISVSAHSP